MCPCQVCVSRLKMDWLTTALVPMTLVLSTATPDGGVCHLHNYVSSCVLNILEEHIEATAIINHCHVPLDITFLIVYQYQNSTRHSWKYTFVTTNQNERVLIPGLLLPIAPHAPVFLYARVPEKDFNLHNSSFLAIQASFIAELSRDKWEEADFLNHTVFISRSNDCHYTRDEKDPVPWIIGSLFGVAVLLGLIGGGYHVYQKRNIAADQLALVSAMEVGVRGAPPYQMGSVAERSAQVEDAAQEKVLSDSSRGDCKSQESDQGSGKKDADGRQGFVFTKLREQASFSSNSTSKSEDSSVIITNPAYKENNQIKKQTKYIKPEELDSHSLPQDETLSQKSGDLVDTMCQNDDTPNLDNNQQVLEEATTEEDYKTGDESIDGSSQIGQGARRKVRGVVSSSSSMVTAKEEIDGDFQNCL